MEEKIIEAQLMTPMFSQGAYREIAELRPSELKGMMRYLYRISNPIKLKQLAEYEADLFGGSAGGNETEQGHASPVQYLLGLENQKDSTKSETKKQTIVLHKSQKKCCLLDNPIRFKIRKNKNISITDKVLSENADLEWYKDLAELTLMLCGLGKRSRKGRGRSIIKGVQLKDQQDALHFICEKLNKIAGVHQKKSSPAIQTYKIDGEAIKPVQRSEEEEQELERPVIQKIRLGKLLPNTGTNWSGKKDSKTIYEQLKKFLEAVDSCCHDVKNKVKCLKQDIKNLKGQISKEQNSNGQSLKKQNLKRQIYKIGQELKQAELHSIVVGSGGKVRLASPLIIGFVQTEEGIYPVYTFIKIITNRKIRNKISVRNECKELDSDLVLREEFIKKVEEKQQEELQRRGGKS